MAARIAVFLGVFAYLALFRRYGFQLEDEGTLLYQIDRFTRGEVPYTEFHTGYTPGFFAFGGAMLSAAGHQVALFRLALAAVHAASALGIYEIASRFVRGSLAFVPVVLWIGCMPLYAGDFASFNVPYPAWFVLLPWVALVLTLMGWMEKGGFGRLVLAGFLASLAFAVKPNSGAFAGIVAAFTVCAGARCENAFDRRLLLSFGVFAATVVWSSFGFAVATLDAAVHILPLPVLLWLLFGARGRRLADQSAPTDRPLTAIGALAVGFVPLTVAWAAPTMARLGVSGFLRDVLFIGSDAAAIYWKSFPPPEPFALLFLAALVALGLVGRLVASCGLPVAPFAYIGAAALLAVFFVAINRPAPEGVVWSMRHQFENASLWIVPLVHWLGIFAVWKALQAPDERPAAARMVLLIAAIGCYWQIYPRPDFTHVVFAFPFSAVLAVLLLSRTMADWRRGDWPVGLRPGRVLTVTVWSVLLVGMGIRVAPALPSAVRCVGEPAIAGLAPRIDICASSDRAEVMAHAGGAVDVLRRDTEAGESAIAFPSLAGILFAAELASPFPHDYFYPGRPNHEDERAMLDSISADPPRRIVALNRGWWALFLRSPSYYGAMRAHARRSYRLTDRFGRIDVYSLGATGHRYEPASPTPASAAACTPPVELDPNDRSREAAAWIERVAPGCLRHVSLSADEIEATLQLRGIRAMGDMRAVPWIFAGLDDARLRVRYEARSAAGLLVYRHLATVDRWGTPLTEADVRPFAAPFAERAKRLREDPNADIRAFAAAVVSAGGEGMTFAELRSETLMAGARRLSPLR